MSYFFVQKFGIKGIKDVLDPGSRTSLIPGSRIKKGINSLIPDTRDGEISNMMAGINFLVLRDQLHMMAGIKENRDQDQLHIVAGIKKNKDQDQLHMMAGIKKFRDQGSRPQQPILQYRNVH